MTIVVNLDVKMAKKKMSLKELSKKVDISVTNLSLLKTGKVKGIRFNNWLRSAMCWNVSQEIYWNM